LERLSIDHEEVLLDCIGGLTVTGYRDASLLREVQEIKPEYIQIYTLHEVKEMTGKAFWDEPGKVRPYFGAKTTKKGMDFLIETRGEEEVSMNLNGEYPQVDVAKTQTTLEKIYRAQQIVIKYEDINIGATTEELKELRLLASDIARDTAEFVAQRYENAFGDEEDNES
jgi:hypothetical protein